MEYVIEIENLSHRYGERVIYDGLDLEVPKGEVVALLGKNGVGKTTLIKLLMGFLRPRGDRCRVLGEDSHALSPATRARIGLLFEGHLAYELMTIDQIERFYSAFYPRWRCALYYDLVDRMGLPRDHRIGNMSCGQRSQVVLGLIFAQDPELMILDDYSMGLDAGYRRLFLEYLEAFLQEGEKSVFLTSHVVQDMERMVGEMVFLQRGGEVLQMPLDGFTAEFRQYDLEISDGPLPGRDAVIHRVEHHGRPALYAFAERDRVEAHLREGWPHLRLGRQVTMTLEDAFIGLTGKY